MTVASPEIWFVQSEFYPYGGDSCRLVEIALETEARLGWKPVILTARADGAPEEENHQGIRLLRLCSRRGHPWDDLLYTVAVCREIQRRHSSVAAVHINSPGPESALIIRTAGRYDIRSVIQLTLLGSDDPQTLCQFRRYTRPVSQMLVRQLANADAILALSEALAERAIDFGWPSSKVRCSAVAKNPQVFRPPRDPAEKAALRRALGIDLDAVAVTYVGYLSQRKGTDVLIEAWKQIAPRFKEARLLLAGESSGIGPESFSCLCPSTFRLLGPLPRLRVAELLRASDIFVFPTRREGFGAALLEAVMCGLPTVASNLPGITDMIVRNDYNGILCTSGDAAALIASLESLIQSDQLRNQMRARAQEWARRFYPDAIWPMYQWAYCGSTLNSAAMI